MDWGKTKFFLGEVARNFTRNAAMQITAIGTVAVTIVLLGAFLFVRATLAGLGTDLLSQIEISVYTTNDATPKQIASLESALRADPRVASVEFIPKKQGLVEMKDRVKGEIDMSLLTENPLPDKLRVKVKAPETVAAVAASAQKMPGVANAVFGQDVVAKMLRLGSVLRGIGIGVIVVFVLVAGIIISNTIRLTVFARRREIAIMQLVGATNTYIRMPFICEGLLDGILGAGIALALLAIAKSTLWPRLLEALPGFSLANVRIDGTAMALELLLVGALVGAVASWISVGRYLRT
ncbi:MAG TPA: permease-like cell division protein FtsX [Candidatus Baltobacteraceae bacterium]